MIESDVGLTALDHFSCSRVRLGTEVVMKLKLGKKKIGALIFLI